MLQPSADVAGPQTTRTCTISNKTTELQPSIIIPVRHHPCHDHDQRRLRPHQLRLLRGGLVHHHQRHGAPLAAVQEAVHGAAHKGQPAPAHNVLRHLRLPGHVPLLCEPLGGVRRTHIHNMRDTGLLFDDRVEEEALEIGEGLRVLQ